MEYAVYNGTLSIRDVLRGRKLSVSMPNPATYSPIGFINMDSQGGIPQGREAGFIPELLDELARRAGFTWRESYALFEGPDAFGKTYTDLLVSKLKFLLFLSTWGWVDFSFRTAYGTTLNEKQKEGGLKASSLSINLSPVEIHRRNVVLRMAGMAGESVRHERRVVDAYHITSCAWNKLSSGKAVIA
jgi:hypothetical protein